MTFGANQAVIALRAANEVDHTEDVNRKKNQSQEPGEVCIEESHAVTEFLEKIRADPYWERDGHGKDHDAQFQLRDAGAAFEFQFGARKHF